MYSVCNKYYNIFFLEQKLCNRYSIWNLYYVGTSIPWQINPLVLERGLVTFRNVIYIWWRKRRWHFMYISTLLYINMEFPNLKKNELSKKLPNWSVEFSAFRIPELKFLNIFQKHPDFPTKTLYSIMFCSDPQWTIFKVFNLFCLPIGLKHASYRSS